MVATTPFIVVVIIPDEAVIRLELMMLEVDTSPFTLEVRVLTADERSLLFTPVMVVVAITPFTSEVKIVEVEVVATERTLPVMIEEVAVTPLTVEVKTLPVADWVKLLIMFARPELIPFTITSNTFAEDEATLEVMIEEVDVTPFTVEVRTLAAAEREFWLTKFAVVVATTPLTTEVRTKSFVVVDIERV